MFKQVWNLIRKHKIITTGIIVVVIGVFFYYRSSANGSGETLYTVAQAEKGILNVSVSGTGQVEAITQVDIKPKVSGNVLTIPVQEGQKVKMGTVLVQLDTKDLQTQVNQAALALDMAKANLNSKLAGPTKEDVAMSANAIKSAQLAYDNSLSSLQNTQQDNAQSLQSAQLALDKAQAAADNAQKQYDNTLSTVSTTNDTSTQDLSNLYSNAKTNVDSTLISLQSALPLADTILGIDQPSLNSAFRINLGALNQQSLIDASNAYPVTKNALADLEKQYNTVVVQWDQGQVDDLLATTVQTSQKMQTLIHNVYILLSNTITGGGLTQSDLDGYKNSFSSKESDLINRISSLQSVQQSIASAKLGNSSTGIKNSSSIDTAKLTLDNAKRDLITAQSNYDQVKRSSDQSLLNAQQDIQSKKIALDNAQASYDLKVAPPRAVDVASIKLQIKQAQESYNTAKQNMQDATVTAPIDGIVAKINVHVGDIVANGQATNGTAMVTMITQEKYAQLSLNEVDAAKVAVNQKANISFDALDGLNITGNVISVDLLGTVSQGVVTYNVKVGFDTQDDRIKPGMSANVSIITLTKMDVVLVSSSAIKTQGSQQYVQVVQNISDALLSQAMTQGIPLSSPPTNQSVEVGSSNDSMTEIASGVQEGDYVVVRTSTSSSSQQRTSTSSGFGGGIRIPGVGGGGFR